jgi:dephospho-CoA kinase
MSYKLKRHKIGLTGGIGSGKTTVCMIFKTLGVAIYDADTQAKQLMNTDPDLKSLLKVYFGDDIYRYGTLDRRRLADIIFNDKTALERINSLVHPVVVRDFEQWCVSQTSPYVLEEAAIIFESNIAHRFKKTILVTAPDSVRIERVCARDNVSPEMALERMKNQWSEEKKMAMADYVIYNNDMQLLTPQVMEIHRQLLNL